MRPETQGSNSPPRRPMTAGEYRRLLALYPTLLDVPSDLQDQLRATGEVGARPAGRRVFEDGDPCEGHSLLLDGTVRVSRAGADGRDVLLYRVTPGESCVLTAVTVLGGTAFPATGTAETDIRLVRLPQALFLDLVTASTAFRRFVFTALTARFDDLMTLVGDALFRRVDQRLAVRLLRQPSPITATHRALADDVGTSREVVSRILETFAHEGLVKLGRRRIDVVDRVALEERRRHGDVAP